MSACAPFGGATSTSCRCCLLVFFLSVGLGFCLLLCLLVVVPVGGVVLLAFACAVPAAAAPEVRRWVRVPGSGGHVRLLPLVPACLFRPVRSLPSCRLLVLVVVAFSVFFFFLLWLFFCRCLAVFAVLVLLVVAAAPKVRR